MSKGKPRKGAKPTDVRQDLATTLSAACRRARKQRMLTQEEVAAAAGVSVRAYAYIEKGKRLPKLVTFVALADALGVSADTLLGRTAQGSQAVTASARAERSPTLSRVLRMIYRAPPRTLAVVAEVLEELEKVKKPPR